MPSTFDRALKALVSQGLDDTGEFVARLLLLGYRDHVIAKKARVSERTAKRWVGAVLLATGAESRAQLWPRALALGQGPAHCREIQFKEFCSKNERRMKG